MKKRSSGLIALLFATVAAVHGQTLEFGASDYSANEEQATVTLTVVKSGAASGPVTVHYATSNNPSDPVAAQAGTDYSATSGDLTFAPNESTKQFSVPILEDSAYEDSEYFFVALSNPTGGAALRDPSTAQVRISDNDPQPKVQFSAANYNVNENAGAATLVISKTGATEVRATVYYKTHNGTATAPSDFTFTGDDLTASVTFEPGENSKQIEIPIHDDGYREPDETFQVDFVLYMACTSGTRSTTTVTIVDDDPQGPSPPAKALNISTRARVQTGDGIAIGGFIITGSEGKSVLIRALGPSLAQNGIPSNQALLDPVIRLNKGDGSFIDINDNWREWQANKQLEGTVYEPKDDREAVLLMTLLPGAYTVWVVGKNQTQGIGLFEVYDLEGDNGAELANLSTRGYVGEENDVMIGGFILGNEPGSVRVAVRGLGPSLADFGLKNVLPDPALELHDANGTGIATNDDWETDPTSAAQLIAHGLAPSDSKEAGIAVSLPPGAFTAILNGKFVGTGIGLVEVYNLK
jgi:hypothetical protein